MTKLSLVWMRRNLRLDDNKSLYYALKSSDKIVPLFIFDSDILQRFNNSADRRLSFLASTLENINQYLNKINSEILIFYGRPIEIIPKLVEILEVGSVHADEDFEELNIKRDCDIASLLKCEFHLHCDHLLIRPGTILKQDKVPYKVYTPYMKIFRRLIDDSLLKSYKYELSGRVYKVDHYKLELSNLKLLNIKYGTSEVLKQIGYIYKQDLLWPVTDGYNRLNDFVRNRINSYKNHRSKLDRNGTSAVSPYLRFGLISIRECFRQAFNIESSSGCQKWINELIWREFYACILYHFPITKTEEFQERFRSKLPWQRDMEVFNKFTLGQTGFPIIDASVKQLLNDGWMHNRMRMVSANFFCKVLFIDWRLGEEFFAQHLMDYDLSSNVGGWQWSASCGVDPQPYFRTFNPFIQGHKFDTKAKYVKHYLPELQNIADKKIHDPKAVEANFDGTVDYPAPIVEYSSARREVLAIFKDIVSKSKRPASNIDGY